MNIVFGVSGEGLGHAFEALEIAQLAQSCGHTVKILTFGDRACDCLEALHPTRIAGLSLHVDARGKLSLPAIFARNLKFADFYVKNWRRLRAELATFAPDVFVTFYEPVTTFAAHLFRKPLISMDNQNIFFHMKKPRGASWLQFHLARLVTSLFTYGAAHYVIKCLKHPEITKTNLSFVSPNIQTAVRELSPARGDHVLVYLTHPNPRLIEILKAIPETFVVYCNGKTGVEQNLSYRAPGPGYLTDLGGCKAIIATTGFSLINDAIYLKKPYFGVPIKGHFEQINNAHFLRDSGFGEFSLDVTKHEIEQFLSRRTLYETRMSRHRLDHGAYGKRLLALLSEIEARERATALAA